MRWCSRDQKSHNSSSRRRASLFRRSSDDAFPGNAAKQPLQALQRSSRSVLALAMLLLPRLGPSGPRGEASLHLRTPPLQVSGSFQYLNVGRATFHVGNDANSEGQRLPVEILEQLWHLLSIVAQGILEPHSTSM